MPIFQYEAIDSKSDVTTGSIEAANKADAPQKVVMCIRRKNHNCGTMMTKQIKSIKRAPNRLAVQRVVWRKYLLPFMLWVFF